MLKAEVLKVDDEMALAWLARTEELGFHNRRLSNQFIKRYAHAMREGRWQLNGETIILDESGALLNGQHRLHAVLEVTTSDEGPVFIEMLVAQGVKRSTFQTMDQGVKRTAGQILGIGGISQGESLAALVRKIYIWETNRYSDHTVARLLDNSEITELATNHREEFLPALTWGKRASQEFGRASLWAFVYWLFTKHAPNEAQTDFLEPLVTGADLGEKHPVLALRRKMLKARAGGPIPYSDKQILSLAVRSWNALQQGRGLANLPVKNTADPIPKLR